MSTTGALVVSAEAVVAAHLTADEARRELALALYGQERLALGQAAALADLAQAEFLALAGGRGLTVPYGEVEFEEDLATLRRLGRL